MLEDGTESGALVVSNADPKRTFLGLWTRATLPGGLPPRSAGIKMDGPCAKVNLVLSEEPRSTGMPADADAEPRARSRSCRRSRARERCYDQAQWGEIPEELWVDCVVASNVDATLAPAGGT